MKPILQEYLPLIIVAGLWEIVWKLLAMWRAGRNNQVAWFIAIALVNSLGILPILYLVFQRKQPREPLTGK